MVNLNFGYYHGSRVDGTVFRDDGTGAGIANDGIRQAGETGISGSRVQLLSGACAGGECDSTLTDGAGAFSVWIPFTAAGAVSVQHLDVNGWISTGGSAGSTGGAFARATDAVSFTAASGVAYSGLVFGDVPLNTLAPNGAQTVAPGSVCFCAHRFTAMSDGTVTFGMSQVCTPSTPSWSIVMYLDANANGAIDAGESPLMAPLAVTSGQTVYLVCKCDAPIGAPSGAQCQCSLTASFDYAGASPALSSSATAADVITVVAGGSGLVIAKSVDRATARPGDVLIYTITYTNNGPLPLSSIVIHDATPSFTVFQSASCGTLGTGLSGCAVSSQPAGGASGPIAWTLTGALAPGASGSVTFQVRVP